LVGLQLTQAVRSNVDGELEIGMNFYVVETNGKGNNNTNICRANDDRLHSIHLTLNIIYNMYITTHESVHCDFFVVVVS
jgi:hypothetical protein